MEELDMVPVDSQTMREVAPTFTGAPAASQAKIIAETGAVLAATLDSYDINTRLRIAHFLGQTCEESADFGRPKSSPAARNITGERTWATRNQVMARGSKDAGCCS